MAIRTVEAAYLRRDLRVQIERAIEAALDLADSLMAQLDAIDGDADHEDDGTAEPLMAALVTGSHDLRWCGYEGAAA